jgi:hypothetical protein
MKDKIFCRHGKVYINGSSLAVSLPSEAVKLFNIAKKDEARVLILPYLGQVIFEFNKPVEKQIQLTPNDSIPDLGRDEMKILKVLRQSPDNFISKAKLSPLLFGRNTLITRKRLENAVKYLVGKGLITEDYKAIYKIQ